jgi:hypothetical protein
VDTKRETSSRKSPIIFRVANDIAVAIPDVNADGYFLPMPPGSCDWAADGFEVRPAGSLLATQS